MEQTQIVKVMHEAITTIMLVSAPPLILGMIVGIIVSIFQATTQINEQTLAFVPKIIAIFIALLVFGGWMLTGLSDFTIRMFSYVSGS
ncbi:MAG TPA: flagellar biosynthesis protein FliQ [Clostridia bacterium]|nr:MAG: Flagellar biosynthetic protein FliQ [Firmicutes bacterium ADurb.Bin356]HOR12892.1 flagellar biosynthesis protein FliQ [Clostridia bacterium]HPY36970.1 flagellar biosynthesis protein FliQ [Clostridia bacterium]